MTEERWNEKRDDKEEEQVEAHRRGAVRAGKDEAKDVEAHGHGPHGVRMGNDEPASDESDDVEAHARRATHRE